MRNTGPVPKSTIRKPARAGPITRPRLNEALFRPTALDTSSGPTISMTNACRAGASTEAPMPSRAARTNTCQTCTTSVTTSSPRKAPTTPMNACVRISSLRFA
jgi:hypothetical protein